MDPSLLMLLPKGIVTNNTDIYDEVASYPTVPPDKVYEYWHGMYAAGSPGALKRKTLFSTFLNAR